MRSWKKWQNKNKNKNGRRRDGLLNKEKETQSSLAKKKLFIYNRRELSVHLEKESTLECALQFCPLESDTEENIMKK